MILLLKSEPSNKKYRYRIGTDQNIKCWLKADGKSKLSAENIALVMPQPGQGMPKRRKKTQPTSKYAKTAIMSA